MESLVVPAVLDSLDPIGRAVLDAARAAGLDRKATYRLRLAVDEVATNIITHGYQEANLTGDITLAVELDSATLTIVLEDEAIPFDPRGEGTPEQIHESLEERPIGGLGVFLALKNVDRFDYQRAGEKNRNVFVMNRTPLEATG